jgi:tRNA-binding protein
VAQVPSEQGERGGRPGLTAAVPQHEIDPDGRPYEPARLPRKRDVDGPAFFAIDMRTGVVTAVEAFPEARKPAWKIEVDFGPVVGRLWGSAQITNYSAEKLLGRTVVGAINLGERRIAGFRSQFLVLGALDPDGTVRLLELPDGVAPGSVVA